MHKSLLLSSILLASAGCAANGPDGVAAVQSEALEARANLVDHTFVSNETYSYTTYDYVHRPDGSIEWIDRVVEVKVRLKFIQADNYELDDHWGKGLDYEVVAEKFVEATGETFRDDNYTFFVRKTGKALSFFNCGSTRRCYTEHDISSIELAGQAEQGQTLTIGNLHDALIETNSATIAFTEVRK